MNNSEAQRKLILEGSIPRTVSKMAVPSVVMQLITLIYNTVDTYFIAQIDKSAAAAVGTVFAIQAVIQAVGFGFGMAFRVSVRVLQTGYMLCACNIAPSACV